MNKPKFEQTDWTDELLEYIKTEYLAMKRIKDIADHVGCSQSTIIRQLGKMGVSRGFKTRPTISEDKIEFIRKYGKKLSTREIATQLGISMSTVNKYRKYLGLTVTRIKSVEDQVKEEVGYGKKYDTLCWTCGNAADGKVCSWSDRYEPVKGWETKEVGTFREVTVIDGVEIVSLKPRFVVTKCPLYWDDTHYEVRRKKAEKLLRKLIWGEEENALKCT